MSAAAPGPHGSRLHVAGPHPGGTLGPGAPAPGLPASDRPPPDVVVDCLGRPCPVPVIELARALAAAADGAVVEVIGDDPAARLGVPAFCRMRGHDYLGERPRPSGTGLQVRRARTPTPP